MKNSNLPASIILLIALQLIFFNNIIIFKGLFPIIYIIFIIFYNLNEGTKPSFLFYSFLLGLILDIFTNTPGLNAFSAVFAAYTRKFILGLIKKNYFTESSYFKFSSLNFIELSIYVFLVTLVHHSSLYLLEGFKISSIATVLLKSLCNSILSSFFILLFSFFKKD